MNPSESAEASDRQLPDRRLSVSRSVNETAHLGQLLGQTAPAGAVLALIGDLGAGKTTLTQAVVGGLGVDPAEVSSPTFVLIQEYPGRLPVYHFDTYRLRDVDEFVDLGAEELLYGDGVCLVEWADRVTEVLPDDRLQLEISSLEPTTRQLAFTALGPRSRQWLNDVWETLHRNQ